MDDDKREKIHEIALTELHPFKNHPFHVEQDDELRELAKSIADHGVVTPGIVRPKPEGGYELISGHRRKAASELADMATMPVVIRDLDDDAATIIMVDSNQQRENLLPSEKAFAYKMKLEAMKHQGKRTDLTCAQLGHKPEGKKSIQSLADGSEDSRVQIQRYIRLTNLIPDLLRLVDEKSIAMSPAVELSYLPKKKQEILLDFCRMQQCTPSLSQAVRLKALQQTGKLTELELIKIMSEQKANQRDKLTFRADKFAAYFPKGYTAEQMEQSILRMLAERQRKLQKSRDDAR
ncbi:ParB/RepB/Spo0J family partition protein [Papillibacter cinnamivorans]|uniref:Chromosome partitioning protein, ParB family n=1 Tax=Papillibacter cinnamivorans DSM 12816 TaxID=1122930 RepID=A0A1W2ARZ4_9FIRM|nr:ParB/RepB/Spo0J family partition protein [Papillibacter cinnamivorans]SMC63292.1 chromosome partitioning protein, ParB family [Papillibacter cinnamivorans DSM 12816]